MLACSLLPVSLLYRFAVSVRILLFRLGLLRRHRLPVPVIVVGNVVAGGAGKTPAVMALVRHLRSRGLVVGVVSRGYGRVAGRRNDAPVEVFPDSLPDAVGDEPLLIRRRTRAPVFIGRSRAQAAVRLLAVHPTVQVIVCDDGLQHLALVRDIEVCVFDNRGVGNGWLLPAGPLREPWPRKVDAVLHTGSQPAFAGGFSASRALSDFGLRADGSRIPLMSLAAGATTAVAGIAQPEAFFAMLRSKGMVLKTTLALPDHYDFKAGDTVDELEYPIVCTEKDATKLWQRMPGALAVPLAFTPEAAFFAAIDQLLDRQLSSTTATRGPTS